MATTATVPGTDHVLYGSRLNHNEAALRADRARRGLNMNHNETVPQNGRPPGMTEIDAFRAETMPRLTMVETAFHNGDAGPREALWSHRDPVTLFGAVMTKTGWAEIAATFDRLASRSSNCEIFQFHVITADVSGDFAYIAGIEHTTASIAGAPPEPSAPRVITIFRREGDERKVVYRAELHPKDLPRWPR